MFEVRRQHADDHVPIVVDAELASDRRGRRAESALPQLVADHDDFGDAERVVLRAEQPAELRVRAKHVEIGRAREKDLDALRFIDLGQVGIESPHARDAVEQSRAIAIVRQFGG